MGTWDRGLGGVLRLIYIVNDEIDWVNKGRGPCSKASQTPVAVRTFPSTANPSPSPLTYSTTHSTLSHA